MDARSTMLIRNILCCSTSKLPGCTAGGHPQYARPVATCWSLAASPSCGSACLTFAALLRALRLEANPAPGPSFTLSEIPLTRGSSRRCSTLRQCGVVNGQSGAGQAASWQALVGRQLRRREGERQPVGWSWGSAGGGMFSAFAAVLDLALRQAWRRYTILQQQLGRNRKA